MKSLRSFSSLAILILAMALLSGTAFAWPACSGNWIQVPAGTSTANGAIVTENGQTFQCQKPTPPPPSTGTTNTNTNSNANTNNNNNQQSQGQSQGQGQSQTANGGNAKATALGGAGGSASSNQTQSNSSTNANQSSASNQSNGNGSNSNNTTNNIAASKIPVPTAYAPATIPTSPCFKGFGGGVQTGMFGGSIGGGKVDPNCAILETARSFDMVNERLAACKVKISNKYAKKAGVTLEDCMHVEMVEAPVPVAVEAPAPVAAAIEHFRNSDVPVRLPDMHGPGTSPKPSVTIVNPEPTPVKVIQSPVVADEKPVVKKKRVARRLPPGCQNVVTLKCNTTKYEHEK